VKQVAIADRPPADQDGPFRRRECFRDREPTVPRLNPGATVIVAMHGDVPPYHLFGAALFDPRRDPGGPGCPGLARPERHEHHAGTHDDNDVASARSACLSTPAPVAGRFQLVDDASQWRGERPVAVKGILHLQEEDLPWRFMACIMCFIRQCR